MLLAAFVTGGFPNLAGGTQKRTIIKLTLKSSRTPTP
jgi:hypothetical protein